MQRDLKNLNKNAFYALIEVQRYIQMFYFLLTINSKTRKLHIEVQGNISEEAVMGCATAFGRTVKKIQGKKGNTQA